MKQIAIWAMGMVVVLGVTSGCRPTQLGQNYGESYSTGLRAQISHPERVGNADPAAAMDGEAASSAVGTYRKTFEPRSVVAAPQSMIKNQ
jgi:type IV pilus biogenesis protein CpaD/CtpE